MSSRSVVLLGDSAFDDVSYVGGAPDVVRQLRSPDPRLRRLAAAGLAAFNDAILRAAFSAGLPVVDLRLVCSSDAGFANPVEPSERGGARIAAAARLAAEHDFGRGRTEVYVG